MPVLRIDLANGFDGDHVRVEVNGRVVFDRGGVKTRYQIELADSCEAQVDAGPAEVRVVLPELSLSATRRVDVDDRAYVEVERTPEGRLAFRTSEEPFRRA